MVETNSLIFCDAELEIKRPEQVWVSDITYIKTRNGYMYLTLITDAYSKKIMGYKLAENMKTVNNVEALKMALRNRQYPKRKLIHHSDRGFQYCADLYTSMLEKNKIKISMTTKYDPYENAVASCEYLTPEQAHRGMRFTMQTYGRKKTKG